MKISIETCANTIPNEVAEELEARVKVVCETPAGIVRIDDPICCEACGLKKALNVVNKIVFAKEIDEVRRMMGMGGGKPPVVPGDEWKEGQP